MKAGLRDPWVRSALVLAILVLLGFFIIIFSWHKTVDARYAPLELPWIVSDGFAGVAVIGFAMGAWKIHVGRRIDAAARNEFEAFCRSTAELAERMKSGQVQLPSHARPTAPAIVPKTTSRSRAKKS